MTTPTPTTAGGAVLPVVGYITQDCDFRLSALWNHDQHGALTLHAPARAEIDALRAELAALKAALNPPAHTPPTGVFVQAAQDDQARDAGRLDWLLANPNTVCEDAGNEWFTLDADSEPTYFKTGRAAIDAAIAAKG